MVEHSCLLSKHAFHPCRGRICKVCGRTIKAPLNDPTKRIKSKFRRASKW